MRGPHAPRSGPFHGWVGFDAIGGQLFQRVFVADLVKARAYVRHRASVRFVLLMKRVDKRSQVARAITTNAVVCRLSPRCEMPEDEPGAHKRDADDDERDAESSLTVIAKTAL